MKYKLVAALAACLAPCASIAIADAGHGGNTAANQPLRADGHAPIGVMGDHRHSTGEVMLSYRFMRMDMAGNQIGTTGISPTAIATSLPNRFAGMPGQPPTLRIVPTEMEMDMHMFGAMYAPNDRMTLMAMVPILRKSMNHLTFSGAAGPTVLGGFNVKTEGLGDIKASALVGLWTGGNSALHANLGLSLPTGSITETHRILTPMGMRPTVRVPYAMQLGSGTFDLLPGITYTGRTGDTGYGAQLSGVIRLGDNDEGYSLGDEIRASIWASHQPVPAISFSGRVEAKSVGRIDGRDMSIMGPVQTADPRNYGGETVSLHAGVNFVVQKGAMRGHRFAIEAGVPVYQDLNGVQMETDWTLTAGWQYAF
ncbi:transporter [Roseovarius sp. TE539]|uniref:transporter n=1 Tax=Roseovarius sp. TE539 TaxID=2249812 RepID=UPI000DDE67C1|nr:transporter [Roseovarius sp. TE539]RBI72695.1 transporter [Roseovarius sp. TE539]